MFYQTSSRHRDIEFSHRLKLIRFSSAMTSTATIIEPPRRLDCKLPQAASESTDGRDVGRPLL
jgi:hypothetical protein